MQSIADAEPTLKDLLSPEPSHAPRKQAPAPASDLADTYSPLSPPPSTRPNRSRTHRRMQAPNPGTAAQAKVTQAIAHSSSTSTSASTGRSKRPTAASKAPDSARLPGRWRTWCVDYEWVARAAAYDRRQQAAPQWRKRTAGRSRQSHRRTQRTRTTNRPRPIRRAAASNAARRAYRQNQRRWHAEGRLCRGITRTGPPLQTPRPARRTLLPHAHSAASAARPGPRRDVFRFKANLHHTDKELPPNRTSTKRAHAATVRRPTTQPCCGFRSPETDLAGPAALRRRLPGRAAVPPSASTRKHYRQGSRPSPPDRAAAPPRAKPMRPAMPAAIETRPPPPAPIPRRERQTPTRRNANHNRPPRPGEQMSHHVVSCHEDRETCTTKRANPPGDCALCAKKRPQTTVCGHKTTTRPSCHESPPPHPVTRRRKIFSNIGPIWPLQGIR